MSTFDLFGTTWDPYIFNHLSDVIRYFTGHVLDAEGNCEVNDRADSTEGIRLNAEEEVRFGMAGNLCRCTGYQNIVKAILAAAAEMNAAKEAAQ